MWCHFSTLLRTIWQSGSCQSLCACRRQHTEVAACEHWCVCACVCKRTKGVSLESVCACVSLVRGYDEQVFNKDPTYELHMVPNLRNGLHHSHFIIGATGPLHAHVPTLKHTPSHVLTVHSTHIGPHIHLPTNTSGAPSLHCCWKRWKFVYILHFSRAAVDLNVWRSFYMVTGDTDPLYVWKWSQFPLV